MSGGGARVPRGARLRMGRVEGDLEAEPGVEITGDGPEGIVITGAAEFRGDAIIHGPFQSASVRVRDGRFHADSSVTVGGLFRADDARVEITGPFTAEEVDVDRALVLHGEGRAHGVEVGGQLEAERGLTFDSLEVGGRARVLGRAQGREISVGGQAEFGEVDVESLAVGGLATVGTGVVRRSIEVGGTFEAGTPFQFGSLEVGGAAQVGSGRGGTVEVGGRFRAIGTITLESLEVGGMAEVAGGLTCRSVEVGGWLKVAGPLTVEQGVEVGGVVHVEGELSAGRLEVGGSFTARSGKVRETAEIGASVETDGGLRASRIEVGRRGRVRGYLAGDDILINRDSSVGACYGGRVRVRRGSSADLLVGETVEIESDCRVARVVYRTTLRAESGVLFGEPPVRSDTLPSPPG